MGRYDTAVRCEQIRTLVEENQYLRAMEEIEKLDYEEIPTISDLYLFADVFLRAEKMDIAKELYYIVYRRTASRPALYRLLMLVIQMGDIEEAKELYLAYEVVAGVTLDTYELRYRLAKASGEPRAKLIDILEHLKEDEYTEEWGYQLARLYELEGMREKCIEECESIRCWFGTGAIVDKAEKLKKRCMSPSWRRPMDDRIPEPEKPDVEEPVGVAYAPVRVEEIVSPERVEPEPEMPIRQETRPEAAINPEPEMPIRRETRPEAAINPEPEMPIKQETRPEAEINPEPEMPIKSEPEPEGETESEKPIKQEASAIADGGANEGGEPEKRSAEPGFFKRLVNYFKIDLDMFEEEDTLLDGVGDEVEEEEPPPVHPALSEEERGRADAVHSPYVGESLEALNADATAAVSDPTESLEEQLQAMTVQKEDIPALDPDVYMRREANTEAAAAREPSPVQVSAAPEGSSEEAQVKSHPLGSSALTEDIVEDVSKNGIHYNTLKGAIYKIRRETGIINIALTGGASGISLAVAKRLSKELKKVGYFEARNIGKISADKLDAVNLDEWAEKFIGGCMYITEAPSLSNQSVQNLSELIRKYQKQIVIMLEGSYDEMDSFFNYHRGFEELITYKVHL